MNDRIPSSKFHTFPHSDYATFEISTKTDLIPSHIQENRHFNNLKYIKLEAVKTILCQFFKLLKDFHHFLMCLYSKTSTYFHVSNLILHTQLKNSREFQTSTQGNTITLRKQTTLKLQGKSCLASPQYEHIPFQQFAST